MTLGACRYDEVHYHIVIVVVVVIIILRLFMHKAAYGLLTRSLAIAKLHNIEIRILH